MKAMATPKQRLKPSKAVGGRVGPFEVAAVWPHSESPFLLSLVGGEQTFVATSFSPVSFESIADRSVDSWRTGQENNSSIGCLPRWFILLPYEAFADEPALITQKERPLAWEIKAGLTWTSDGTEPTYMSVEGASLARFHLSNQKIKEILGNAREIDLSDPKAIRLTPNTSDETYLATVRNLIRSITEGDFYQINLLRFFLSMSSLEWDNLCSLMRQNSGPHGVLIANGNQVIASFSPERFIEIKNKNDNPTIHTWPIKGTAPRYLDNPQKDLISGEKLLSSTKDLAELHMIIDLMRNDFLKICSHGTVQVLEKNALKKFSHFWHLEGEISGTLSTGHSLRSILSAVCPGGSITGAPKLAAMARIKQEEARARGFFMGNFLRINYDGTLQSNIMIRTLVSDNWLRRISYAAGSGLVVKSEPELELLEIWTKCAPLTLKSARSAQESSQQDFEDE